MQQSAPEYVDVHLYRAKIARALGVQEELFIAEPLLVNTGNSFVIVGFKDKETLAGITPDQRLIEEISESLDLIGFYVFSLETYTPGTDASARMFAPRFGIPEESATGMAAGPLACYMYKKMGNKKQHFEIEQGYAMAPTSPSRIYVELVHDGHSIKSVLAGGTGKLVEQLHISV